HRGAAGAQAGRVAAGRGVRRGREGQGGGEDECGRRNAGGRVPDGHAASNSIQVICSTKSGAEGSSIPTVRTSPPRRPFPDAGGPARRPPSGGRGPLDRRPGRRPPSGPSGPERPRAEENTTPPAPRSVIFGWSGAPARAPRLRADRRVRVPDTALRAVPPAPRPAAAASADRAARPSRIRVPAPRSGAALPPRSGGAGDLEKNGEPGPAPSRRSAAPVRGRVAGRSETSAHRAGGPEGTAREGPAHRAGGPAPPDRRRPDRRAPPGVARAAEAPRSRAGPVRPGPRSRDPARPPLPRPPAGAVARASGLGVVGAHGRGAAIAGGPRPGLRRPGRGGGRPP